VVERTTSPAGWGEARVVEDTDGNSQVQVAFEGDKCLTHATSTPGTRVGLRLHWIDDTTLEVRYPAGVMLDRPGSPILECADKQVRLVLTQQ
jgi:hypothetical protein